MTVNSKIPLTRQEAASEMHLKWQGGALNARPYKNQFKGHFDPNFTHNLDWGTKTTLKIFQKLGF